MASRHFLSQPHASGNGFITDRQQGTLLFLITGLHMVHGGLGVGVNPAAPVSGGAGMQTGLRPGADAAGNTDAVAIVNAVFLQDRRRVFCFGALTFVLLKDSLRSIETRLCRHGPGGTRFAAHMIVVPSED